MYSLEYTYDFSFFNALATRICMYATCSCRAALYNSVFEQEDSLWRVTCKI